MGGRNGGLREDRGDRRERPRDRTCGPVGLWACEPVSLWACGPVGLWACGPVGL